MLVSIFVLTFAFLFLYFFFCCNIFFVCFKEAEGLCVVWYFWYLLCASKKGYQVQKFVVLIFYNFVSIFAFICFDICFYCFNLLYF